MANRIISFVIKLKNSASEGVKEVVTTVRQAAKTVEDNFSDAWQKTKTGAVKMATGVKANVEAIGKKFEPLSTRVTSVGTAMGKMWHRAADGAHAFFASVQARMRGLGSNLANIKAGFDMLANGFRTAGSVIRSVVGYVQKSIMAAFDRETLETRFKVILGSADKAAKHVKMLAEVGRTTPFSTEQIANASQALLAYTQKALGGEKSIRIIGDAAAATGGNIEELSMWTGRLYAAMKGGQSLGEMLARLVELKVVTPELRRELEAMAEGGSSFEDMWGVYTGALSQFSGGMRSLATTGNGLISTLKDNWNEVFVRFGKVLMDVSKNGIRVLIDGIDKLTSSGALEKWAGEVKKLLEPVVGIMQNLFAGGETRKMQVGALKAQFGALSDYLFERMKLAFDYGASVLAAKLNPLHGEEWKADKIATAQAQYKESLSAIRETLQNALEDNSTKAISRAGAQLDDPTGEKRRAAFREALQAEHAARMEKIENDKARQQAAEKMKAAAEKKAAEEKAKAEKKAALESAKEQEKAIREQIAQLEKDAQPNADAIRDKQAWVEQSRREEQALRGNLDQQREAWGRRSLRDVDAAEEAQREERARAKEAARFDRRVQQAKISLERVGGDETKLSRRDRLILGMDKKSRENMKRAEDEIKKHQKDRQDALNHMIRLDAAVQQSVQQREKLTKLLEDNLKFQGGN